MSCLAGSCDSTTGAEPQSPSPTLLGIETYNAETLETPQELEDESNDTRRSAKSGRSRSRRSLGDSQSSGRKDAAKRFPLVPDAPCEWANKANCGGGTTPILGCIEGKQQARHHGPDKNVQNNEEGNVHRICHYCHYRWHAKNDKDYDWNAGIYPPHDPRPFTEAEKQFVIVDYMRYLSTGKRM